MQGCQVTALWWKVFDSLFFDSSTFKLSPMWIIKHNALFYSDLNSIVCDMVKISASLVLH